MALASASQEAVDRVKHLRPNEWCALVDRIKASRRLEDVIEATGYTLQDSGRELRGIDHDSLVVHPEKQVYKWYRLDEGGDVLTWVMRRYNVELNEAIAMLDEGVDLPRNHVTEPPRPRPADQPPPELPQDLHIRFHRALDDRARDWWHSQGIMDAAIARFFLGAHDHHVYGRCYTIPIIERGKLVNLRMRLEHPENPKDKYRPYAKGYGTQLFNSDILTPELGGVVIVAGEKKAVSLWQHGIPAVSPTGGCSNWKPEWTTALQFCQKVYICFDPTEQAAAWKLAETIGERSYVLALEDKPDDWIQIHGRDGFRARLLQAEPFADRDFWRRQTGGGWRWGREI